MARAYGRVALGGTFDRVHIGHEALLRRAFAAGDEVVIGLTSDAYLKAHPKALPAGLRPYAARARGLRRWLRRVYPRRRWEVVPLHDRYGRAIREGIDALVVSAETRAGGDAVNAERRRRGLRPLPLLEVPLVLADDLGPVSSTRIRSGEIGPAGERRAPLTIVVVGESPHDLGRASATARRAVPVAAVRAVLVRRTTGRASARASRMLRRPVPEADLVVAVAGSGGSGWFVAIRSRRSVLAPRWVPGRGAAALARGIRAIVHPSGEKPI